LLDQVVETNSKKHFAFDESKERIRASQGHSVAIDLDYSPQTPPDMLYHGTAEKSVSSILNTGLEKRERQYVHLSLNVQTATQVGGRHGKPVVLTILAAEMQAAGYLFYLSENKIWLADHVPVQFIRLEGSAG
jgi:putative RNA 2'-phosphotransferase